MWNGWWCYVLPKATIEVMSFLSLQCLGILCPTWNQAELVKVFLKTTWVRFLLPKKFEIKFVLWRSHHEISQLLITDWCRLNQSQYCCSTLFYPPCTWRVYQKKVNIYTAYTYNLIYVMKYQVLVGKKNRVRWDQRHVHPVRDVQPAGWHRRRWQTCLAYSVGAISGFEQWPHGWIRCWKKGVIHCYLVLNGLWMSMGYGLILYSEHFLSKKGQMQTR